MGWNPTSRTLTKGFTKIGAGAQGDLEKALGRVAKSHLQLICDIDGNGARAGFTNPAAKYKPFCYPTAVFATEADRETARLARNCGLTMRDYGSLSAMWSAALAMDSEAFGWAYEPPRAGNANEPKRANDFVDGTTTTRGYCSSAAFSFDWRLLPNPCNRWSIPPKIQLPPDVMATANCIQLSDLNGDGASGYTSANHAYHNLGTGFYFGVAIAAVGASGPQWVYCFDSTQLPLSVHFFDNLTTSGNYDVVFFFFKPSGGSVYDGGTAPLAGKHILAPYPHIRYVFNYTLGLVTTAIMNSARTQIDLDIAMDSGTLAYTAIQLLWADGGTTRIATFTRDAGTLTTTSQHFSASYSSGWTGNEEFYLRITTASATKEEALAVMIPQ